MVPVPGRDCTSTVPPWAARLGGAAEAVPRAHGTDRFGHWGTVFGNEEAGHAVVGPHAVDVVLDDGDARSGGQRATRVWEDNPHAMRIVAVEPVLVEVPLAAPVRGVHGTTRVQRSVLVQVTTDQGVEGWGNVDPTPGYSLVSATDIHDAVARLAGALVGADPFNLHRALAVMDRDARPGHAGAALKLVPSSETNWAIAFTPDGKTLVTVRLSDLESEEIRDGFMGGVPGWLDAIQRAATVRAAR